MELGDMVVFNMEGCNKDGNSNNMRDGNGNGNGSGNGNGMVGNQMPAQISLSDEIASTRPHGDVVLAGVATASSNTSINIVYFPHNVYFHDLIHDAFEASASSRPVESGIVSKWRMKDRKSSNHNKHRAAKLAKRKMSVIQIKYSETYERGKPKPRGLSDPRLGTIDRKVKCETYSACMDKCPGHFGHLELAKPMYHIGFLKTVLSILRFVCFNSSHILANEDDHRFKQALKVKNSKHRLKKVLGCCKNKTKCEGGDVIDEDQQDGEEEVKKKCHGGCGAQQPKISIYGMKILVEYKVMCKKVDDQE